MSKRVVFTYIAQYRGKLVDPGDRKSPNSDKWVLVQLDGEKKPSWVPTYTLNTPLISNKSKVKIVVPDEVIEGGDDGRSHR